MDEASLTLYKLRVFCEVVELQSFTGAAARLHTTQPALSLHMRSLEKFFGAPLVRQEGRRTVLTEAGAAVYRYANDVLRQTEAVRNTVGEFAGGAAGEVSVGASPPAGNYVLPDVLVAFKRLHPLITLHLRVASGPQMGADMLSGVNDFAVAEVGADLPDGLATEPLWDEPILLFCGPGNRLADGPVSASTLAGEPLVGNAGATLVRSQLEWQMTSLGVQLRPPALDLSTTEAVKRAVAGGAGIGAAYRCEVADDLKAGTLCELQTPDLDLYQTFALVYRRNKRFSPVARRLLDHLRAHWGEG